MPDYAVGTKFTARDEVTPAYRRMGDAADNFRRRTSSAFRNATKEGYKFGTVVKGILAANAIRGGLGFIAQGIRTATSSFVEFDDVMVGAAARFDDIGPAAADFGLQLAKLKQGALAASSGTKYTAVEIGTSLDTLAKAGYTSVAALGTVRSMMDLAQASGEDFAATVSMSNDLLGAFGMRSANAQEQIANQARLNDILAKSGLDANGELLDMFETMKMVGPVSRTAGMGVEEVVAMAVALSNAGIKGSQAATALKHAILNIPSRRMAEEFEANGVAIADSNGNIRKYSTILGEIAGKISKLGNREQTQILERIFGLYGIAGGANLIKSLSQLDIAEKRLKAAGGTAKTVSDIMNKYSMKIKLGVLANAALEKSFQVFDAFEYRGKRGIEALTEAIRKWNPERLITGLEATATALGKLWGFLQLIGPYLPAIIQGWIAFRVAVGAIKLANLIAEGIALNGVLGTMNLQLAGIGAALGTISAAMLAVTAAWAAGKSAVTGKDNWISEAAQWLGIVPKLATDANGVITGRAAQQNSFWSGPQASPADANPGRQAPNSKEAQARASRWEGQLTIAGAPPGSTLETKERGVPSFQTALLGLQP